MLCLRNNNAHISPNHVEIRNNFHGKVKNRHDWAYRLWKWNAPFSTRFFPATGVSEVTVTETDACFLTTQYQVVYEISRIWRNSYTIVLNWNRVS